MNVEMKQYAILFLIACVTLSSAATLSVASNASQIAWQPSTAAIYAQAKQQNKLVFLDLTAEWCLFCKKMDETTYRDAEVVAYINEHFLPVRVSDEGEGELIEQYRRHARPGTVMLNADGIEILHKRGYLNAQLMLWMMMAVVQDPSPEVHK
jgi:thiol:disulfide interchange protein